jgi:DNA-binding CsgD family transcriptional regulator
MPPVSERRPLANQVLRASGVELEQEFALGVVRQLFERYLASVDASELEILLDGAAAARPLLRGREVGAIASDTSFSVQHGLYWLAANLSAVRPLLLAVDDAHWADEPSLRWMVYLARRLEGLRLVMLAAFRPQEPTTANPSLLALRGEAAALLNPALLSQDAIAELVRATIAGGSDDNNSKELWVACGGNPLYLCELLRGLEPPASPVAEPQPAQLLGSYLEKIGRGVIARVRSLDPAALRLAQALAVLGERCALRHAAAIAGLNITDAIRLTAGLVRLEVLAMDDPPGFIHPVIRQALEASLRSDERDAAHRAAARLLHADQSPAGRVAAHLLRVRPAEDMWVLARLREAAQEAMENGAPGTAADLLNRALSEPPCAAKRIGLLCQTALAEANAGREAAFVHLDEARRIAGSPRERSEIALEAAEAYAALFRWADAVKVIVQALAELSDADEALAARLQSQLVICGLHDARCAPHVAPVLQRLGSVSPAKNLREAVAVARGMAAALSGRPAEEVAAPLESALACAQSPTTNWDTRAALLWSLVTAERFEAVETALGPMLAEVHRSGSARGLIAIYSTLGLLKLRLGALPEADSAARVALRVLQDGDFRPGLPFAATVLADVAIEAGELDEAEALLALLPRADWPAGVGTVLIAATRGRLRLAQGRPADALADFKVCAAMFSMQAWGAEIVGYVCARAGAALALLQLGDRVGARDLAQAELAEARRFRAPRALGMALRTAGLVEGGEAGLALLTSSVVALRASPARLEQAHSLAELGAALRRAGHRAAAREPLTEALDLSARCGARASAARVREELKAIGARPRSEWRTGLEALSPRELHVARLATEGLSNREIAHRLYVTLKTVEGHLSRAFTKLGIERRGELRHLLEIEKTRAPTL